MRARMLDIKWKPKISKTPELIRARQNGMGPTSRINWPVNWKTLFFRDRMSLLYLLIATKLLIQLKFLPYNLLRVGNFGPLWVVLTDTNLHVLLRCSFRRWHSHHFIECQKDDRRVLHTSYKWSEICIPHRCNNRYQNWGTGPPNTTNLSIADRREYCWELVTQNASWYRHSSCTKES